VQACQSMLPLCALLVAFLVSRCDRTHTSSHTSWRVPSVVRFTGHLVRAFSLTSSLTSLRFQGAMKSRDGDSGGERRMQ
jgi:hypothetical protein